MNFGIIMLIITAILLFVGYKVIKKTKRLNTPNVYLISGGVKTGKTAISVALVKRQYRKSYIGWLLHWVPCKIFKKENEKPLVYSNIPLRDIPHNRLTIDILLRKVRIPYRSIVLIDEASLVADSMLFKSDSLNQALLMFVKLFGHETRGGYLFINSQSVSDLHFAFKRSIGSYLWVLNKTKYPFVTAFRVREMIYSGENETGIVNDVNLEAEEGVKPLLFFNSIYRSYDRYCYSIFTDNLPVQVDYKCKVLKRKDSLKANQVVSMRDVYNEFLARDNLVSKMNKERSLIEYEKN